MAWQPRPNSHAARIIEYLASHPAGASDSELEHALGGNVSHQTVNITCRSLEKRGVLQRGTDGSVIKNRLITQGVILSGEPVENPHWDGDPSKPWDWEGNVQLAVMALLTDEGWSIQGVANTATQEHGKDIRAQRNGFVLWVTVKGYPKGTEKTNPSTQARHWFSQAMFDVILWREESVSARIAVALPDKVTYRNLAAKTTWFQKTAGLSFIWVSEGKAKWA